MNSANNNGSSGVETAATPRRAELSAAPTPSQPRLGRWVFLIVLLLLAGLLAGFIPRWLHRRALAGETVELAIPTVNVVSPVPGKATAALTLPAEVKAFVEAPIYARANGYVTNWYADIGAQVKAGEQLADIDTPELDEQLSEARANLAQADAALALSKITADRWAELLKTSSVSEQENAEKQADLKLKIANVDAAKANVHRLEDLHSFTRVTAPFAGTVTLRNIDVGDLISSGKELFRLADTSKLRVFVRVPQTATPSITTGVDAILMVPEKPSRKFLAKVVRTAGAIETGSRTLLVELQIDNTRGEILPGSYAQVSFGELKQDPALVLPSTTLLFRGEGTQVGVVDVSGRVELHDIVLGRDFGRTVEVVSGLTAGDLVINNPSDSLITGNIVRVAPAATETAQLEKTK
jgi:membrane fusion protein (multidrug efflux system)